MFTAAFPSGPWQASCYLVGPDQGPGCVVVDPGMEAAGVVERLLAEHQRRPEAVLLSHGHLDHMADAAELADAWKVPVWVHPADRELLSDPVAGLGEEMRPLVVQLLGGDRLAEPARVAELTDGQELELAGLRWRVRHAPGHRPGCVIAVVDDPELSLAFTGDVLFAGSIGRTDLPGGDPETMRRTLDEVVGSLPDEMVVLPGHGPVTTLERERATNPYLQPGALW
ncbi:MAG: MBL fold metallo-hydrolase [Actinomycetia bacterium]|nr:MBL fold metallo-hydrolase [Actinomycetes bacterium]